MIKRLCDICHVELSETNRTKREMLGRVHGHHGELMFEILTGLGNTWNHGDFCDSCIREAVIAEVPGKGGIE
jgi:hypothetical protein